MIETLSNIGHYAWSFILILSVIVFIHEFGHYLAARLCGVRVEVFSIGFGRELFGINDAHGTRWKFSLLPLGGYVRMFGDASEASTADSPALESMSDADKKVSFHFKPLWKKAIIVVAGPLANFVLSIAIFSYFIASTGLPSTKPTIGEIMPDSPALEAGLQVNDTITHVNAQAVHHFRDIATEVALNTGEPITLQIMRNDAPKTLTLTPKPIDSDDGLGNTVKRPLIGIKSQTLTFKEVGLFQAIGYASLQTYELCKTSIRVIGQMVSGQRDASELQGPLGIAKLSGDVTASGESTGQALRTILWFIALLSVNLGFINLLPIPLLDGGHLLFYILEGARGRPMAEKIQEYSFRLGFILLMSLMAFTLFNDVKRIVF